MKYQFRKPELTCEGIEKELGLARGEVTEINIYPDGTIEVDVVSDLTLTQKSQLMTLFELKEKAK